MPTAQEVTKRYIGSRGSHGHLSVEVEVEGNRVPLAHHVRHSPTGFECGYGGSGPAELARCILIDHFALHHKARRDHDVALPASYQDFKFEVIAELPRDSGWTLTSEDIDRWVAERRGMNEVQNEDIAVGSRWQGKGPGAAYQVEVTAAPESGKLTLKRLEGGTVGAQLRVHREQLLNGYDPIKQ